MKSVLKTTAVLVAVLSLTTTVDAATKTRSAKATTKGTRVAAVKKNVAKPTAADVSAANSDIQMSETAKLSEVKPVVQAKKWSLSADVDTYARIAETNNGATGDGADVETDYAIKAGYKIADTMTLQGAVEWYNMWGTGNAESKNVLLDPSIRLSKSDLADLGMGVGLSGQARLYFPVSEASIDKEQIAQLRVYLTATRAVSKALSASFTLNPRFFAQQNDYFLRADGKIKPTDKFRLLSSVGLKYAFNDIFAVEQTVGVYQKWKGREERADYLDASTSVYITATNWLEINAGIRQSDEATDTRSAHGGDLYNDDVTEYFLTGSFSI